MEEKTEKPTYPQQRKLKRRVMDYCQAHERRGIEADTTAGLVKQHAGQWKMLLWGVGITCSMLLFIYSLSYQSQKEMAQSVHLIEKTFSAHIAGSVERNLNIVRQMEEIKIDILDLKVRVRLLEQPGTDKK